MATSNPVVGLVPRVYPLLREAVEQGVGYGWMRGWKHLEGEPEERVAAQVREQIEEAVVGELLERFAVVEAERPED